MGPEPRLPHGTKCPPRVTSVLVCPQFTLCYPRSSRILASAPRPAPGAAPSVLQSSANGKVKQSRGSHRATNPLLTFLLKGHQLLGAVRMIRQPGLHNKEDIPANNFPLSSSELDVFHAFLQGCCQDLFALLTQLTLEGIWLEALL